MGETVFTGLGNDVRKEVKECFKRTGMRVKPGMKIYFDMDKIRRNKMRGKKLLAWLGLFFFLFTVCLMSFSGVSAAEKKEILVGAPNSLTGGGVMPAAEQKWAYEQAVADINKKGGVFVKELNKKLPIKLILADDKSMPDGASGAMEKLIKMDKVDLTLSSDSTPKNMAAATIAEKYKVFFTCSRAWPEEIEKMNYKWVASFFFSPVGGAEVPFKIWDKLPEADRIKKPVLYMEDNQDGQAFGGAFKAMAEKHRYKFVMDDPYAPGAKTYSPQILKMKALDADAVLWLGNATDGITLIREIKQMQTKLRYIHGWRGMWPTEFLKALGKDSQYVVHDGFWTEKNGAPGAKELGERYTKAHGKDSVSIGQDYANVQMLAMAIERAGSIDSEKVRSVYVGGEFKGTTQGDLKFNEKAVCYIESIGAQWWNGERMPIWPPNEKLWTLKLIPVQ